jgi:hypothetical protein
VFFNTNLKILITYNIIKILLLNFLVKVCLGIRVRLIHRNGGSIYLRQRIKILFVAVKSTMLRKPLQYPEVTTEKL